MALDDIISVSVEVKATAVTRPSFGVPLIASKHSVFPDRVMTFSTPADLIEAGFTADDIEFKLATALKARKPSLPSFKLGRLSATTYTQTLSLVPTVTTEGFIYTGTLNGEAWEYEVQSGATVSSVCIAIAALLDADAAVVGTTLPASPPKTSITLAAASADTSFAFSACRELTVEDVTSVTGSNLAADLTEINLTDPAWYGLILAENSAAMTLAAAAWTESNAKLFFPHFVDTEILSSGVTDDIASQLVALTYHRTLPIWHRGVNSGANAGWAAVNLSDDPGSYTASFKQMPGIPVDVLRPSEEAALKTKRVTRFTTLGGVNVTYGGRAPSGRYGDTTRFVDWLQAEVQFNVLDVLLNSKKVPNTATGRAMIKTAVMAAISAGVRMGGLDPDYDHQVYVPPVSESTTEDLVNRICKGITFDSRLSGALEGAQIAGTLVV